MLLGIDVGTSSLKGMLMEPGGRICGAASSGYDVSIPVPGRGEQDPEIWWQALCVVMKKLRENCPDMKERLQGIGFSGQMHGLVMIDQNGKSVRPAILWMDQRSGEELEEIREKIPMDQQAAVFHNRMFSGFALPSLLWIRHHEPDQYRKIRKVFQPKDYLRYRMTGKIGTEESDASASLMFDVGKRNWAVKELEKLGISEDLLPETGHSWEIAGELTREAADQLGLRPGVPVVYGAGDQQAQSIGNGACTEGLVIANIGTGAQISCCSRKDVYDPGLRTHTFCHAIPDGYTIYGAILSGGISLKWLKDQVIGASDFSEISRMAAETAPGSDGLLFLPYLSGERTPLMNPKARGMFFGLDLHHHQGHLARAVMEGVTYALRDSLEILKEMGIAADRIIASGGAARSPVWLQIQADILGKEIQVCKVKEQACLGACILAGVGVDIYKNIQDACGQLVEFEEKIYVPGDACREMYEAGYQRFHALYEATRNLLQ